MSNSPLAVFKIMVLCCLAVPILLSCAAGAPVQEMSNARQAIQAAEEAKAPYFAPQPYESAKQLLEGARTRLEQGDYFEAREMAVEAKQEAIRARQLAHTAQKRQGTVFE